MLSKHKQPSLEAGLLVILVVISVFSIGLYTGPKVAGMATAWVAGIAVKNKKGLNITKKL